MSRAASRARRRGDRGGAIPAGASSRRGGWSPLASCALLAALTILCLAPFAGRAFNIDEPLFVWAAKQIQAHPLDPYGFAVNWSLFARPMSEVTQNPPLASYYAALIGAFAGWSERALHLAFLLPALGVVLGTYLLARRLCKSPLLAGAAALLAPGFLVSASAVMCDTMMLALWLLAVVLWIEGLEREKPALLLGASLLIAASALTKYFAMSLIPLLFLYSLVRRRRLGNWAWYFAIPIVVLAAYQGWTRDLYGRGLLTNAATYARGQRLALAGRFLDSGLDGLAFAGGCMLPALLFVPLLWRRRWILIGAIPGIAAGLALARGWLHPAAMGPGGHGGFIGLQYAVFLGGGLSVVALAVADLAKRRDAEAMLLALWVLGTLVFAGLINWTVNARSVLPLIPAAAILLARRLEAGAPAPRGLRAVACGPPLLVSGLLALGVAQADAQLADSARRAAALVHERTRSGTATVWFQGHWGFQYYMEALGARPADFNAGGVRAGDFMVIPGNNATVVGMSSSLAESEHVLEVPVRSWLTTMSVPRGAGFHATVWGPLPFAFGPAPTERYRLMRLLPLPGAGTPGDDPAR